MKKIWLIVFFFVWKAGVTAQDPNQLFSYDTDNGLISNSISEIFEDYKGFIWIASRQGLQRFDGYRFEDFTPPELINTLRYVNVMSNDSLGRLYVGTQTGGLVVYDRHNKVVRTHTHVKGDTTSLSNRYIADILHLNNQTWLATYDGLNLYDFKTNSCRVYRPYDYSDEPNNWIVSVLQHTDTSMLVMNKTGQVFEFFIASKVFQLLHEVPKVKTVKALLDKPFLWLGTESSLVRINLNTRVKKSFSYVHPPKTRLSGRHISDIVKKKNGEIWISTYRGINIYNNEKLSYLLPEQTSQYLIGDISIHCLLADAHDGIWIGTSQGGVNFIPDLKQDFHVIRKEKNNSILASNELQRICGDSGNNTWVGTVKGVTGFDAEMNKIRDYQFNIEGFDVELHYFPFFVEDGVLWIGTSLGYILLYSINDKSTQEIPVGVNKGTVINACKGENGKYYARIYTLGIFEIDSATHSVTHLLGIGNALHEMSSLSGEGLCCLNNKLYFGTSNGMDVYDLASGTTQKITDESFNGELLISGITCSSSGNIWLGAKGGILQYNLQNELLEYLPYTVREEIFSSSCLEEDAYGNVWFGTSNGLYKYCLNDGRMRLFLVEEGLHGKFFRCSHQAKDGKMVFGGLNGLTWFYPDSINDVVSHSNMRISYLKTSYDSVYFSFDKKILLAADENSFDCAFTLQAYGASKYTSYAYLLEGYDKNWQNTKTPLAKYSNLPNGRYQLRVKALNYANQWSEEATVDILVMPHVWQTMWFKMLAMLLILLVGAITIYVRYRLKNASQIVVSKVVIGKGEEEKEQQSFAQQAGNVVQENMSNGSFDVNILAKELGVSSTALYKKLKTETGKTPHDFITTLKMEFAANLLKKGGCNVSEAAYKTGYSDIAVFSRNFKKYFGVSPSKYNTFQP